MWPVVFELFTAWYSNQTLDGVLMTILRETGTLSLPHRKKAGLYGYPRRGTTQKSGKMAVREEYLLSEHEDLSSDPQNS